jgi:hypothetical protein
MRLNKDLREFIELLNSNKVECLPFGTTPVGQSNAIRGKGFRR